MLRRIFGRKPTPPTLPLEYRAEASAIPEHAPSTSPVLVGDVTDAEFDTIVLQSDQLVVVDVWAEWCQPCTIISAYAEWLAQEYSGRLRVVALDADENPAVPERYQIMGLPTLLFFRGGAEIDRQVGLLSYEELCAKVEAHLAPNP